MDSETSDIHRAELFDSLGHPVRLAILQSLSSEPLGFSDLKRILGIESSGHLTFHLGKLDGLVKVTPEGNYALTDIGREALRLLETIDKAKGVYDYTGNVFRQIRMTVKYVLAVLSIFIFIMLGGVVLEVGLNKILNLELALLLLLIVALFLALLRANRNQYIEVPETNSGNGTLEGDSLIIGLEWGLSGSRLGISGFLLLDRKNRKISSKFGVSRLARYSRDCQPSIPFKKDQ